MRILHLDSGRTLRGGQWQTLRLAEGLATAGHNIANANNPDYSRQRQEIIMTEEFGTIRTVGSTPGPTALLRIPVMKGH